MVKDDMNAYPKWPHRNFYRHKRSGDVFAIETDATGQVISTSGPLLTAELDPKMLDFDEYWNSEIQAKLPDFERITKANYRELLRRNGFVTEHNQRYLF